MLNQHFKHWDFGDGKSMHVYRQSVNSMFGEYGDKYAAVNCGKEVYNDDSYTSLLECKYRINAIDKKIWELKKDREITEIAMVKCLECSMSSNLKSEYVSDVFIDYMKKGFNSEKFQAFFKEVKKNFLSVPDANGSLDYLESLKCTYFSGGNYNNYDRTLKSYKCSMEHCVLHFIYGKKNYEFGLFLPIADNTHFTVDNLDDNTLGRYYVNGPIYKTDASISFKACNTAKFIMELLTTDKYLITANEWMAAGADLYQREDN